MPGSLQPPSSARPHREAVSVVTDTTTNNDGKLVPQVTLIDPDTGLPYAAGSGGGGGGLSITDESAWTAGSSKFTPTGGEYNDSAAALTSGQQGGVRVTPNRAVHVNLRTQAGAELSPSLDGTDSSDGNATQATAGVGLRGWLSTLVSLFRAGTAKVVASLGPATIPSPTTMQSAVSSSVAGTALTTTGYGTARLKVSGTWVGTITPVNDSGRPLLWTQVGTDNLLTTIVGTGDGVAQDYTCNCSGMDTVSAPVVWTSGTSVTVVGEVSPIVSSAKRVLSHTNAWTSSLGLHRNAITAVDKVSVAPQPTSGADVATGGGLAQGTNFYMAFAFGNKYGTSGAGTISAAIATAASGGSVHGVKATGAAATTGTPEYVDIFMTASSTAPLWVGRCTYAQFSNANGVVVTAVGTVSAGSSLGAYVVQVNVLGTGLAANVVPFLANNAYTPELVAAVGTLVCQGKSRIRLYVTLAPTDLRSLPTASVIPARWNATGSTWHFESPIFFSPLVAARFPLLISTTMDVDGGTYTFLLDSVAGQGTAVSLTADVM